MICFIIKICISKLKKEENKEEKKEEIIKEEKPKEKEIKNEIKEKKNEDSTKDCLTINKLLVHPFYAETQTTETFLKDLFNNSLQEKNQELNI